MNKILLQALILVMFIAVSCGEKTANTEDAATSETTINSENMGDLEAKFKDPAMAFKNMFESKGITLTDEQFAEIKAVVDGLNFSHNDSSKDFKAKTLKMRDQIINSILTDEQRAEAKTKFPKMSDD